MTRWSLFLQTLSLLHHFLGLYLRPPPSLFVLAYNLGNFLRRLCLPKAVKHWSLRSVQVKLDQDGRPSGAALPVGDLSVIRGVGSSTVVPGSVGSYRPVIAGPKLREGTATILARGGERSRESSVSSMRFHPIGRGHEDDEYGQEGCSTTANASLIGQREVQNREGRWDHPSAALSPATEYRVDGTPLWNGSIVNVASATPTSE